MCLEKIGKISTNVMGINADEEGDLSSENLVDHLLQI